jgi:hypothetical protein
MDWCEKNGVEYVFSLTKNAVLAAQIFARTDEVCVKRAIGNLDVVRDRFPRAKIDREGFDERCRVPYPGDPCRRGAAIRVGPYCPIQECSRTVRALLHQNAPLAVSFRRVEAPTPWPRVVTMSKASTIKCWPWSQA